MKLSCEKCSKVFVVRSYEVREYKINDFLCPDCKSPLKRAKSVNENFRLAIASAKNLLTEEAKNRSFTKKLVKLYISLREQKISSMDLTIN